MDNKEKLFNLAAFKEREKNQTDDFPESCAAVNSFERTSTLRQESRLCPYCIVQEHRLATVPIHSLILEITTGFPDTRVPCALNAMDKSRLQISEDVDQIPLPFG